MKTRTNFRKAAVRSAAVVVSFIVISFTVSAQEFWKKLLTNSSFNEIAIAVVEPGKGKTAMENSKSFEADWKLFDMAFDPVLELEGWMSDEKHFGVEALHHEETLKAPYSDGNGFFNFNFRTDPSEPLELEAWMLKSGVWMNK